MSSVRREQAEIVQAFLALADEFDRQAAACHAAKAAQRRAEEAIGGGGGPTLFAPWLSGNLSEIFGSSLFEGIDSPRGTGSGSGFA